MSKQDDAKRHQNYTEKPMICGNCEFYKSKKVSFKNYGQTITSETDKKCGLGLFKVKTMGYCDQFRFKSE